MNVDQAIDIVAQQLVANAAREIEWEDIPDIGEYDWSRVETECLRLTPEPDGFDEAITMLEERAAAWEDTE